MPTIMIETQWADFAQWNSVINTVSPPKPDGKCALHHLIFYVGASNHFSRGAAVAFAIKQ